MAFVRNQVRSIVEEVGQNCHTASRKPLPLLPFSLPWQICNFGHWDDLSNPNDEIIVIYRQRTLSKNEEFSAPKDIM